MSESHLIPIKKIKPKKDSEINFNSSYLSSRFLNINNEAKKLINNSKYKTNFKAVISIANDIYHSFQNNSCHSFWESLNEYHHLLNENKYI